MNLDGHSSTNTNSVEIKNKRPLTVGILIFDQVEVLDVAGPFEVFSVTRLTEEHRLRVIAF